DYYCSSYAGSLLF
nr:immunoglobulin light chain junction region [Macaca mulatta]